MWRHHRQKASFLSLFDEFFLKYREFATEYSVFTKLCRHLAIFRPKQNSLTRSYNELFKYGSKSQLGSITLRMSSMDSMRLTSELHGIGKCSCTCPYVCVRNAILHAFISFNHSNLLILLGFP